MLTAVGLFVQDGEKLPSPVKFDLPLSVGQLPPVEVSPSLPPSLPHESRAVCDGCYPRSYRKATL